MADSISQWALSRNSFTLRKIKVEGRSCSDPDDLIESVHEMRVKLRRAFDRRQRENDRWRNLRCVGCFAPSFDGHLWKATFNGVLDLGRIHEVTFLDAIEPLVQIRLQSFPVAVIPNDIHSHVHFAFSTTKGLATCDANHLAFYFNTINRNGGFKPLTFRRGLQS
jgi:hypothetical protein